MKVLRVIGNVIWAFTGGIITALWWLLFGALLCITIIGIPFGVQCFKFARITFTPFGRRIDLHPSRHIIVNIIWAILFGWEMALSYISAAIVTMLTIVGIPFGIQALKFAQLGFLPFGAEVEKV